MSWLGALASRDRGRHAPPVLAEGGDLVVTVSSVPDRVTARCSGGSVASSTPSRKRASAESHGAAHPTSLTRP